MPRIDEVRHYLLDLTRMDTDHNGVLSRGEVTSARIPTAFVDAPIASLRHSADDLAALDANHNGSLTLREARSCAIVQAAIRAVEALPHGVTPLTRAERLRTFGSDLGRYVRSATIDMLPRDGESEADALNRAIVKYATSRHASGLSVEGYDVASSSLASIGEELGTNGVFGYPGIDDPGVQAVIARLGSGDVSSVMYDDTTHGSGTLYVAQNGSRYTIVEVPETW